ncbi:hypothetical protein GALMADRAFT_209005 [Galerina marginata CBS 339.88]|uniref:CxC2-like cysteine cluster KDZ transposase-associated domain-containing protein n=1 Tax=Galerina marginata (strain CBS 339.88) TaxID=685588 RepID=A0A067T5X7_GALM3|nr:hypothetical protein GALMADRAFT_209005 [Galerina marginata CBS 339.88]
MAISPSVNVSGQHFLLPEVLTERKHRVLSANSEWSLLIAPLLIPEFRWCPLSSIEGNPSHSCRRYMPPKNRKKVEERRKAFEKAHLPFSGFGKTTSTWTRLVGTSSGSIQTTDQKLEIDVERPQKRRRGDAESSATPGSFPTTATKPDDKPSDPPEETPIDAASQSFAPIKPYGKSSFLQQFMTRFTTFMSYLWAGESDKDIGKKCECGRLPRTTRCADCFQSPLTCNICFVNKHINNPMHWAEYWNGEFFERCDISELGYAITLGHHGDICPCVDYNDGSHISSFVMVDVNGVHSTRLAFCKCAQAGDAVEQLLSARIFPASVIRPATGFTFNLLETFQMDCLQSKKSAYDYIEGHGIDREFPDRPPGSIVVPCFACPEPGFNMDDSEMSDEEIQHATTLFLSIDGHFGLMQKDKNNDPEDLSLMEGKGLFPPEGPYQEYIAKAGPSKENKLKFRGCRCSGVVAVTCARHGIFRHGAIADLQLGERYSNAYYALAGGIKSCRRNRFIVLTYDIACQFSINLKERFAKAFPGLSDIVNRIRHFVPKLHIQGHKDDCQYRYSLNFSRWTGRTDGERIESCWSEAKQAGGMTKEMNTGHRQDTLTDFQNDWNWVKAQKLAGSLRKHYVDAKNVAAKKLEHYIGLSLVNGPERVARWAGLSTEPKRVNGEWHSVYRYKAPKSPSQSTVYHDMLKAELQKECKLDATSKATPIAIYLDTGLKIQSKQQKLLSKVKQAMKDNPNVALPIKFEKERHNLSAEIKKWRKQQQVIIPGVIDHLSQLPTPESIELEILLLPSDFSPAERVLYAIEDLVDDELRLQKGQAHDALRCLRAQVKYSLSLSRYKKSKKNAVHGQNLNTRFSSMLRDAYDKQDVNIAKYQRSRDAMIRLGLANDNEEFPELGPNDLWMKDPALYHQLGDGKRMEGWIWRVGLPANVSDAEREGFLEDADRVQWFRARADMERWQEEVEILAQEFRRTIRGFDKMAHVWSSLAISPAPVECSHNLVDHGVEHGKMAYGKKKAAMFRRMANDARVAFESIGGTWPAYGVSLKDHILSERPSQEIDWDSRQPL